MKATLRLVGLVLVLLAPVLWLYVTPVTAQEWVNVTDERLLNADRDPSNWLTYYRTYNGWRYSPLSQVNRQTVQKLVPKWIFSLGEVGNQEGTPVVNNGIMVVTAGAPTFIRQRIYALDAATGNLLWKHEVKLPEDLPELARRIPMNRGAALYQDKVYVGTLDARLIALNAKTGELAWEKTIADRTEGYFVTMAPLAVKGKIIIGISGPGEMGQRGFVEAFSADDGKSLWRTYTIPAAGEKGNETWSGDTWKNGGGAVWLTGTYDPETDLLYFGTGNPAPWIAQMRPGANLWTSSSIALDVETGKIRWGYQHLANDPWDYDTAMEHLVMEVTKGGKRVKAVVQANKLGFVNVLDRSEGQLVSSELFGTDVTWFEGRDPQTGKGIPNYKLIPQPGGDKIEICPHALGVTGWGTKPYNPETGYMYIPSIEACMRYNYEQELKYEKGKMYMGAAAELFTKRDQAGVLRAFDVREARWPGSGGTRRPSLVLRHDHWRRVGVRRDPEGEVVALDPKPVSSCGSSTSHGRLGSTVTYSVGGKQYLATLAGGLLRATVWFGKEPKLADVVNKMNFGGMVIAFGLAE